jgi:hypothetical protein
MPSFAAGRGLGLQLGSHGPLEDVGYNKRLYVEREACKVGSDIVDTQAIRQRAELSQVRNPR